MHTRRPVFACLAAVLALSVSACGSGVTEDAAPPMTTLTETPAADPNPQNSATSPAQENPHSSGETTSASTAANGNGSGGEQENCGVDPNAAAITDNIAQVPAPSLEGMSWTYKGDSNFDPCATLSYATVEQSEQGNSQFQNQLMLFHNGEYLGVGSDTVQQHQVIATTDDSVTVRYKDYEALAAAGAPNAESQNYTTDVTFRWDGSQVVPQGRFPNMGMQ